MQKIHVYALPTLAEPEAFRGGVAVVIDVLRATTTLTTALQAGAKCAVPVLEVDEALALKETILQGKDPRFTEPLAASDVLLGGERQGKRIDGFDFGNSPCDYTPERIAGKTLLFSTTNGTRAMYRAKEAETIVPAAFLNAHAVVQHLISRCRSRDENASLPIHILCAGTCGKVTAEDLLLAGALVQELQFQLEDRVLFDAQAMSVLELWNELYPLQKRILEQPFKPEELAAELRKSNGGKNLLRIGLDADILDASRMNSSSFLAEINTKDMIMRGV